MAWKTRHKIKRKFKQAAHCVENAQNHILDVLKIYKGAEEEFDKKYTKHVNMCDKLMEILEMGKQIINDFYDTL